MLTLNDGRNELWQWDTGRKLTVDADCSQVHFSNKVFGRSIDVDVVDGTAAIPDVLLQVDNELITWAFVGTPENGYTKISKVFKVNKRNKPADYVFTPPEQTTLGQIMKRLDRIEESQDPDAIKNAVDDYLANNPIQIDEKDPTVPAWAKQATKPKYTAKEVGAVASSELSGEVNDALAKAKASGEFDGKSAYEYAREGGYAGTEAEFAAKLATGDDSRFFPVTITDNGDGTYTSDHYWSDIEAAYESGRIPIAVMVKNVYHLVYAGVTMNGYRFSRQEGAVLTTITVKKTDVSVATTTLAMPDDIPDINQKPFFLFTAEEVNEDGTIAVDGGIIGVPGEPGAEVINDVAKATEECINAYLQGRACFLIVQAGDFASIILPCTATIGDIMTFSITEGVTDLFADVREGVVELSHWEMPSTLPNPNALTIGDVTYDGSATVDMTAKINALIDTKLGVIENGTY